MKQSKKNSQPRGPKEPANDGFPADQDVSKNLAGSDQGNHPDKKR